MIRLALTVLAFFSIAGCVDTEQDYVAVVGVGEARTFPTSAMLSLTLLGVGDSAEAATLDLTKKMDDVRAILSEHDLTDDNLESGYFSVDRQTKVVRFSDGSRESQPGDFRARQMILIRTPHINSAGQLLGALMAAGPEDVSSPVYTIEDTETLFEKARSLAIQDANSRAIHYVEKTGKQLGSVEVIEESGVDSQRLQYNLRDRLVDDYQQQENGQEQIAARSPALDFQQGLSLNVFSKPEEISVTVSVYVKYALEDM